MKNFDKEEFLIALEELIVKSTSSVDDLFGIFVAIFADVGQRLCNLGKATRKKN